MSRIVAVAMAPVLLGAVSCGAGSQDPPSGSGGACPLAFVYRSHTYYAYKTEKPVEPDRPLGEVRDLPCDDSSGMQVDSNGQVTDEPAREETATAREETAAARVRAYTIAGVDPADAFVVPSTYPRVLFSSSFYGTALPPEVKRLLNH